MPTFAFRAVPSLWSLAPIPNRRSALRIYLTAWLIAVGSSGVAQAQSPQVLANGVGAPGPVTATGGMALTVAVTNGPGSPTDWVGFYQAGRPDNEWIDWKYLTDSQTAPTVGMTSGTVLFVTPPAGGAFEVRFFSAGSFTRLAVGPGITASAGQTTNIASGSVHTLIVLPDRTVMSWGSGAQIGDGTPTNQNVRKAAAVKVRIAERLITDVVDPPPLTDVVAVAATATSSAAIKSDGTLWTWGQNTYGLLGDGNSATRGWAKQIALSGVVAVAGGASHLLALTSSGSVYAWGSTGYGQIGNGTISGTWVTIPVPVSALGNTVVAIGAAGNTSYAIKANGTLWVWGTNQYGEVGNGTTSAYVTTPTQSTTGGVAMAGVTGGSDRTYAWTSSGALYAWGYNGSGQLGIGNTVQKLTPTLVPSLTNVTKVVAGLSHALAVRSDNTLWSWGFNGNGQLGDGTNTQRLAPQPVATPTGVNAIAASDNYSVAVGTDGRVMAWGGNFSGQLGDSTTWDRWSPQQIINPGFVIRTLRPNFSISGGTYLSTGTLRVYVNAWTPSSTVRYTTDGTTPTTGSASLVPGGFLDLPQNTTLQAIATSPGRPASLAEIATYSLKVQAPSATPGSGTLLTATNVGLSSTTANAAIHYTLDGSTPTSSSTSYTSAIPLATGTTLKAIATRVNWVDSDVLTSTYTFNYGTLATPTAAPVGGAYQGSVTVTLSGPANATVRYTTNGTDPTTASTAYTAPLLFGTTTTLKAKAFRTDYTPSATLTQTYTITTAAPVLSRNSGAYDPGTRVTITTADPGATLRMTLTGADPTSADPVVASGSSLLVGAYTLKVRAFKSGALDSAVTAGTYTLTGALVGGDAAAGGSHTLLATPNGLVYGWGDNGYGQLGDSSTTSRSTPRLIQTLTGVSRLAAGVTHSVGTTMDGQLYTWGANGYGQLGDGTTNSRSAPYLVSLPSPVTAVAAGYYHTLALTTTGRVYAWGWGTSGQLGLGASANVSTPTLIASLTNVVAIAAGQFHSLAVTASGQVYAWGWNANGQLGDGTTSQRLTPTLLSGVTGVTSVAAGGTYSLARTSTGAVYAWGYGPNGELGLGSAMTSRTTPTLIANLSAQAIAAGAGHSAALRTDGSIATWGTNSAGQLGDGTTTSRTTPVSASGLATMAVVSVGSAHTVAVRNDGAVFTWGTGASGRLGDGGTANRVTPFNAFAGGGAWGTPTPVLSLPSGIYRTTQTLGVSAPLGATVRYTTNGQPPTETDTVLATGSALPLTATTTLAFRAWLPGLAPSGVAMAEYEFQPLPPTATPAAGTYLAAQTVTLSAASGTTIRYTLDGTTPTASSPAYVAPVTVAAPATLTATAFQAGWTPSANLVVGYSFQLAAPVATPPGGALSSGQTVALSGPYGSVIHYTLDGSTPTAASATYDLPLTLSGSATLKALATLAGWVDSAVLSTSYTAAPVITSVAPTNGPVGTSVTISGSGLGATQGSATVQLGSVAGTVTAWSDTQIVATVATGATSGIVRVAQGSVTSNSLSFTVTSSGPTITGVVPTSGPVGTTVTITGAGFGASAAGGQIWLANAEGGVVSWTDDQIVATVAATATTGDLQVLHNGLWSNSIAFTVTGTAPRLDGVTPTSGSAGAVITLTGRGFGTTQGSGLVMLGGTSASVTAWSDTAITATVGASAVTGVAKVQQNSQWSNALPFFVPSATQMTLAPSVLGMVVGETRPIQSLNAQGVAVSGLAWSSSDVTVVTLSASDPPEITAVGAGTATIRAGNVSADVTVYAGSVPEGAVRWSHGGNGSGVVSSYIAVPNYDGVADVFLEQQDGSIQAVTADGTVGWAVTPPTPLSARRGVIPDFKGGLVVQTYDSVYALHPGTGAPGPVFTTANDEARLLGIGDPAIHPDGTLFTVDYACHDSCPGNVETQDGAWVVGVDPTTGAAKFRVPLVNSVDTLTISDAAICQAGVDGTTTWRYHAWPSRLMIAGDGFAYLAYQTFDVIGTTQRATVQAYSDTDYGLWDTLRSATNASQFAAAITALDALGPAIGTSATSPVVASLRTALQNGDRTLAMSYENDMAPWFRRPCDGQWSRVRKLHVMRVGPDGSSSDLVIKQWTDAETDVYTLAPGWTPGTVLGIGSTAYHETVTHSGPESVQTDTRMITNADTGALVSWKGRISCYPSSTLGSRTYLQADTCPASDERLATMTNGAITIDVPWQPGTAIVGPPAEPMLQLESGEFAGSVQAPSGQAIVTFNTVGSVQWTKSDYSPLMSISGGLVASGTTGGTAVFTEAGVQIHRLQRMPTSSWRLSSYDTDSSVLSQVNRTLPNLAAGFGSLIGGNPSGNRTAVGVAPQPPALAEQIISPAYGLKNWGGGCFAALLAPGMPPVPPIPPTPLNSADQQLYESAKADLASSSLLASSACASHLAPRLGSDYVSQLQTKLSAQEGKDGPRTMTSFLDAGLLAPNFAAVHPTAAAILRIAPVCQAWITGSPKALAQVDGRGGQARNVYFDPVWLPGLTQGDLLHETLHNITGLTDMLDDSQRIGLPPPFDLGTFVGLSMITNPRDVNRDTPSGVSAKILGRLRAEACVVD